MKEKEIFLIPTSNSWHPFLSKGYEGLALLYSIRFSLPLVSDFIRSAPKEIFFAGYGVINE